MRRKCRPKVSDQEIRDQVLVFLLAGHETTAGALTFTLHLLGRQARLQDEVAAEPTLLRAALLEGMRHRFTSEPDRPRYAYFPFGGGPRSCIGEHFALLEAVELLGRLLARYRIEALDPQLRTSTHVTLRPAGQVRARLIPR
ncbi:MAG: cytochrome P450 [Sporichthyaceae bacterium]|nr:cytochrome P450 [Sporichthyaceae bacterium]